MATDTRWSVCAILYVAKLFRRPLPQQQQKQRNVHKGLDGITAHYCICLFYVPFLVFIL